MKLRSLTLVAAIAVFLSACASTAYTIYPVLETQPVASKDDAADDPAIFIHPTDMGKNLIIGTDKQLGLIVYGIDGQIKHEYEFGRINNVDLRQNVAWNGASITLVGGSNRTNNSLVFYQLDPETGALTSLHETTFLSAVDEVYGFCMYQGEKPFAFVVGKDGVVEQWALSPDSEGQLLAEKVRTFDVGEQCEGMVADDETHILYVGEEEVGIWKYDARPNAEAQKEKVQLISENPSLKADIEGLTIYYGPEGTGYLIASSQGNHTYAIYERQMGNQYLGSFQIKKLDDIEGTFDTDGIDVTALPFSTGLSKGIFVAQDGKNGKESQNFKIIDWVDVEKAINRWRTEE